MSDKKTNRVEKELLLLRNLPDAFKHSRSNSALGTLIIVRSVTSSSWKSRRQS